MNVSIHSIMWSEPEPGIFQYTYMMDGFLHRYFINTLKGTRSPIEILDKVWRIKINTHK
jgi:hypothetical protein